MSAAFREELLNELFTNPKGAGKRRRRLIEKNFKTGRVKITKSYWEGVVIKRVSKAVGKRKGGKHEQFEMDSKAWDAFTKFMQDNMDTKRTAFEVFPNAMMDPKDAGKIGYDRRGQDPSLRIYFAPKVNRDGELIRDTNVQAGINRKLSVMIDKFMRQNITKSSKYLKRKGMSFQHGLVGEAHAHMTREKFLELAEAGNLNSEQAPSMQDLKGIGKEKLARAKRRTKHTSHEKGGGDVSVVSGGKGTLIDQRIAIGWKEAAKEFKAETFYTQFNTVMAGFLDHMFGYSYVQRGVVSPELIESQFFVNAIMAPDLSGANPTTQSKFVKKQLKHFLSDPTYFKDIATSFAKMGPAEADQLFHSSEGLNKKSTAQVSKLIIQKMFSHKTNPDMRLKVNKALVAKAKTKKTKSRGGTKFKKTGGLQSKQMGNPRTGRGKAGMAGAAVSSTLKPRSVSTMRTSTNTAANNLKLRALLNEVLPETVAMNMKAPALRFRTGRLANSVRVDNITTGPRGGNMLIETSYDTDPYGTYAPGGKRYTPQRNPEALIRSSVRTIAMGMVKQRFNVKVAK